MTGRTRPILQQNGPAPNVRHGGRAREGINCSLDWNTRRAVRKARTAPQNAPPPRRGGSGVKVPPGLYGDDGGVLRCAWCRSSAAYRDYHDREWGFPVDDDRRLFEKLCLEGFQAGLSWLTILNKRDAFRRAFAGFDAERVARFGARDVTRLLADAGIVRHRGKIESAIGNAKRALALRDEFGSLAAYAWRFEPTARGRPKRVPRGQPARARLAGRGAGDVEGPQTARLELRRPDHGPCIHAGDGARQRSPRRLPRAPPRASGARRAHAGRAACLMGRSNAAGAGLTRRSHDERNQGGRGPELRRRGRRHRRGVRAPLERGARRHRRGAAEGCPGRRHACRPDQGLPRRRGMAADQEDG